MSRSRISRRQFNGLAASAASLAFNYIPQHVWGANDRFYVAGIGVGGKGAGEVRDITAAGGTFVALCDVDSNQAAKTFQSVPTAKVYRDFRLMLEKEKGIDAVTVSTPDHTHALPSLLAMSMGKHVYCQKPLTHSIYEARLMARAAQHFKVQTQMGNQAHANEPIRRAVELVRAGVIGPVREVHAWTNRPTWPQGSRAISERTKGTQQIPSNLEWDLWLGPAKGREYNSCYAPFTWRGWWDFGTGALGDMACHIMDMPYWALDLGSPVSVEAESDGLTNETGPEWSTITYHFAARTKVGGGSLGGSVGPLAQVAQPAVKFVWYDGRRDGKQNAPQKLLTESTGVLGNTTASVTSTETGQGRAKKKDRANVALDAPERWDLILVGDHGNMLFNRTNTDWIITSAERATKFSETPLSLPRVANEDAEWIAACKGGAKPLSSFDYAGPFTEMVLLGNLAVRLGKKIEWNSPELRVTNAPEADRLIRDEYRSGWSLPIGPELLKS